MGNVVGGIQTFENALWHTPHTRAHSACTRDPQHNRELLKPVFQRPPHVCPPPPCFFHKGYCKSEKLPQIKGAAEGLSALVASQCLSSYTCEFVKGKRHGWFLSLPPTLLIAPGTYLMPHKMFFHE